MRTNLTLGEAQRAIVENYTSARIMQIDHTRLQNMRKPVIDEINSRTPGGRYRYTKDFRSFLAGYEACHRERFWEENFYYAHLYESELYSDDKRRPLGMKSFKDLQARLDAEGGRIAEVPACHLWVGTEKPFTEWATL